MSRVLIVRDFGVCVRRVRVFVAENRELAPAAYPRLTRQISEKPRCMQVIEIIGAPKGTSTANDFNGLFCKPALIGAYPALSFSKICKPRSQAHSRRLEVQP